MPDLKTDDPVAPAPARRLNATPDERAFHSGSRASASSGVTANFAKTTALLHHITFTRNRDPELANPVARRRLRLNP